MFARGGDAVTLVVTCLPQLGTLSVDALLALCTKLLAALGVLAALGALLDKKLTFVDRVLELNTVVADACEALEGFASVRALECDDTGVEVAGLELL